LVTGFDIIFFWVARMIMLGLHVMGDVPFRTVYIHALVRDAKGQKMSKSRGNVIDPLELMDKYGADALRFTLAAMEAQGRDIKLAESRVEGYRNFATKLWNAARFCEANGCKRAPDFDPAACQETVNRWIVGETARAAARTTEALEAYRFNEAANSVYHFTWGVFCDWFLEFSKPVLSGPDGPAKDETRATAAWVIERILGLLHPFMPFVTEELWGRLDEGRERPLISEPWPDLAETLVDQAADDEMAWVVRLVSDVRAVRTEMHVPAGAKIELFLKDANAVTMARAERHREVISRLARLRQIAPLDGAVPTGAVQSVIDEATVILPLADVIDLDQERARLEKEIGRLGQDIDKIENKLGNEKFLSKAPEHVVAEQRGRLAEATQARAKLAEALGRLQSA
jgi:valyl-tRNA synthetase